MNYAINYTNLIINDPAAAEAADASLPKEQGFGYSQLPEVVRKVQSSRSIGIACDRKHCGVACGWKEVFG